MATPKYNTYVGMRYVPIFDGEWDRTKTYEPLTIVSYQGNSYTSRTFIPTGMDINNTDYWALTGNYNAQVEYYRQETARVAEAMLSYVKSFNTVAEMIDDTDLGVGEVCHTNGYAEVSDGGGCYYIINDSEVSGKYNIELDNGNYATMVDFDYVTPEMFGAKGDGTTNDTDAIKTALQCDYNVRGNDNSIYYVKDSITNCKGNVDNLYILYDVNKSITFLNAENITINNCTFKQLGTLTDPDDRGDYALAFSFAKNVKITNCKFENATAGVIFNLSEKCSISSCVFDTSPQTATGGNGYGIVLQCCKNFDITSNTFKDIARHGVYVSYTTAFDNLPQMENFNHWCENVNVSDNIFILENQIQGYNATTFEYPLKFVSTHNAVATANQFIDCIGAVWLSQGDGVGNENILLAENIITGCFGNRASILALSAVEEGVNKNITITANIIKCNNPGIKLYLTENLIVSDNVYSGESWMILLSHEGGDIESIDDAYLTNVKISNNNCNGGLIRCVGNPDDLFGAVTDCYIENNNSNVDNAIFFNGIGMKFERLYITSNTIKGSTALACFNNSPSSFNDVYILQNIFKGNLNWSNQNSTNIYVLRNQINDLSGTQNAKLKTDFYGGYIIASGKVSFTPTAGRNEYTVSFSNELPVAPTKILVSMYGSAYQDTLVSSFVVQPGTMTTQGFKVAYNYVGANIYDITFSYIVVGNN